MRPKRLVLSQSRLNTYDKCQRKYYYYYIALFFGEKTYIPALHYGITVHSIIEKIYKRLNEVEGLRPKNEIKTQIFQEIAEIEDEPEKDYEERLINIIKPLNGVIVKYKMLNAEIWVDTEMFIEDDFKDPEVFNIIRKLLDKKDEDDLRPFGGVIFGGYIDAHAMDVKTKNILVIDWKTGRFSRQWVAPYVRQIQLYTYLMRLNGHIIDEAKIIYVEHNSEHKIDVSQKICEEVYNTAKKKFEEILKKKDNILDFEMINEPIECNSCSFDYLCNR